MNLVLSGSNQMKAICRAVNCLARIGTELMMEGYPEQLVLHTMNASRSALFAVTFKPHFFDIFQVGGSGTKCSILLKSVCSAFRTAPGNIDKLSIDVPNEASKVKWTLDCINGVRKTYWISCSVESESIGAILDRTRFSSHLVVKPKDLNRLLGNFQATLQEITLIATEPVLTPGSDDGSEAPEVKAVELRSFVDPVKDNTDASLHTQLWIDPREELQEYSHEGDAVDVTFSLKELKAMMAFCEGTEAGMHMYFDKAGDPVLFAPRFGPGDHTVVSDYDATMVLATMLDSVLSHVDKEGANGEDDPQRFDATTRNRNASQTARDGQTAAAAAAGSGQGGGNDFGNGAAGEDFRTPLRGDGGARQSRSGTAPESVQRSDRTHVWSDLSAMSNARASQNNLRTPANDDSRTPGNTGLRTPGDTGLRTPGDTDLRTRGDNDSRVLANNDSRTHGDNDRRTHDDNDMRTHGDNDMRIRGNEDSRAHGENDSRVCGNNERVPANTAMANAPLFDSEPASEEVNLAAGRWTDRNRTDMQQGTPTQRSQGIPTLVPARVATPAMQLTAPAAPRSEAPFSDRQETAHQAISEGELREGDYGAKRAQMTSTSGKTLQQQGSCPHQAGASGVLDEGAINGVQPRKLQYEPEDPNRAVQDHQGIQQKSFPEVVPETETQTPGQNVRATDLFAMDEEDDEDDNNDTEFCVHSTPPEKRGRIV